MPLDETFRILEMNVSKHHPGATVALHAGTVDALYRYLVDCNFDESQLNGMHLCLAAEYVYQARPRFWREIRVSHFIAAVDRRFPNWRDALKMKNGGEALLIDDIEEFLCIQAFDEANGEMMLALPPSKRPKDRCSAFEWIFTELTQRGMKEELDFALRDERRCGEAALEVLNCLDYATRSAKFERIGALVARAFVESRSTLAFN
jgi:hypothetical protein